MPGFLGSWGGSRSGAPPRPRARDRRDRRGRLRPGPGDREPDLLSRGGRLDSALTQGTGPAPAGLPQHRGTDLHRGVERATGPRATGPRAAGRRGADPSPPGLGRDARGRSARGRRPGGLRGPDAPDRRTRTRLGAVPATGRGRQPTPHGESDGRSPARPARLPDRPHRGGPTCPDRYHGRSDRPTVGGPWRSRRRGFQQKRCAPRRRRCGRHDPSVGHQRSRSTPDTPTVTARRRGHRSPSHVPARWWQPGRSRLRSERRTGTRVGGVSPDPWGLFRQLLPGAVPGPDQPRSRSHLFAPPLSFPVLRSGCPASYGHLSQSSGHLIILLC
ncbi:MAG: hypothetical protein QG608_2520 [Actinomycetota bacterium]|nr:hypothetical protein [Actinomycetota bacterium]